MTPPTTASSDGNELSDQVNEVRLIGHLTRAPVTKELPSGDEVVVLRVSVPRFVGRGRAARSGTRPGTDWVDCSLWTARLRTRTRSWQAGDVVSVTGALRRRFFRGGEGAQTRLEVEVTDARRVRRAEAARESEAC